MITPTFNNDLFRVQLALSGLNTAVSSVLVERSANEILWSTVRGGTALPISSGAGSLDDFDGYLASGDGSLTTFYRVTTVDPPPGLLLDGTPGAFASTPDDASLDITGDIDLRCEATLDDWASGSNQKLVAKYDTGTNNRSYQMFVTLTGELALGWSTDGTSFMSVGSDVAIPGAVNGGSLAVRVTLDVDNGNTEHVLTFYTAPSIGGPWTVFDTQTIAGITSIFAGTALLNVGASDNDGSGDPATGAIHAAVVSSGAGGGGSVRADPDFSAEPSGTTNFTDAAGLTWTVNGTAEIVSFETANIAVTQSAYVAKSIRFPLLNRAVKLGDYGDLEAAARTGVFGVTGRSFPIATTDVNMADRFPIEFVTDTPEEALRLKLLLRLGDIIYLQSPGQVNPRRPPRSMYVVPDSSAVGRIGTGTHRRHTVPVQEVAAPSPLVVGTTLTHQHIWNEFASLEALWVAYPDLRTLWADVADGSTLVVL